MQDPGAVRSARILVINPNSSPSVTAAIDAALDPLRLAGGPVIAVTDLPEGPASIGSQQDADSVVMPLARRITTVKLRSPSSCAMQNRASIRCCCA